jgi:hypothetical protein
MLKIYSSVQRLTCVWEFGDCLCWSTLNRGDVIFLWNTRISDWWSHLLDSLIQRMTTLYCSLLHTHISRCLVAAFNGGRSSYSGNPNGTRPQLSGSNRNSSQRLTHSLLAATESESQLLYDWRFTANQFFLAPSPLKITTRNFFFQLNPCGHNPYVTSSLTRAWVSPLWVGLTFVKYTYRTYSMLLKILAFALYTSLLTVQVL